LDLYKTHVPLIITAVGVSARTKYSHTYLEYTHPSTPALNLKKVVSLYNSGVDRAFGSRARLRCISAWCGCMKAGDRTEARFFRAIKIAFISHRLEDLNVYYQKCQYAIMQGQLNKEK
jgi:hypothetical protein